MIYLAGFLGCAIVIFFAGKKLSFYGDLIATRTGLGKAWIGLILMASVTSLPELMVGISSSAIIQSPDLAVGDIFGSCAFNLALLAVLDAFVPFRKHLFYIASSKHILSASLGLILIAMAGVGLFLPSDISVTPGIGIVSLICLLIYFFSIRLIYNFEMSTRLSTEDQHAESSNDQPTAGVVKRYILYALITIAVALLIPYLVDNIAEETGIGKSFAGTFLLATSTSLPEIAVSIAAVRMGSVDLAVGNLLGSNIFNILILVIDDAFYTPGIILKEASDVNLLSAFAAILMTAVAIAGFTYRAKHKKYLMALDSLIILGIFIINLIWLYKLSKS